MRGAVVPARPEATPYPGWRGRSVSRRVRGAENRCTTSGRRRGFMGHENLAPHRAPPAHARCGGGPGLRPADPASPGRKLGVRLQDRPARRAGENLPSHRGPWSPPRHPFQPRPRRFARHGRLPRAALGGARICRHLPPAPGVRLRSVARQVGRGGLARPEAGGERGELHRPRRGRDRRARRSGKPATTRLGPARPRPAPRRVGRALVRGQDHAGARGRGVAGRTQPRRPAHPGRPAHEPEVRRADVTQGEFRRGADPVADHDGSPKWIASTTPEQRREVFRALPSNGKAFELVLDGGQHHVFADAAERAGKKPRNSAHHRTILATSTAFWDAFLRGAKAARRWLDKDVRSALSPGDIWSAK